MDTSPQTERFVKSPQEIRKEEAARKQRNRTLWIMLGLYVVFVGFWLLAPTWRTLPTASPDHPYFRCPCPQVFAHQGASAYAPSNTLAAFRLAVKMGADILETDVHATEDEVLVLSHDKTVGRMTNGSGRIKDKTWKELQTLDAGYTFTRDGGKTFPFRGKGVRIPSLEQALKAFPTMRFNLEIKDGKAKWLPQLSLLLQRLKAENRVLIACTSDSVLQRWRRLNPRVPTSGGSLESLRFSLSAWVRPDAHYVASFNALQVPWKLPSMNSLVKMAKKSRLKLHVWTVNDARVMKRMFKAGVHGVITDKPDVALALLKKLGIRKAERKKGGAQTTKAAFTTKAGKLFPSTTTKPALRGKSKVKVP